MHVEDEQNRLAIGIETERKMESSRMWALKGKIKYVWDSRTREIKWNVPASDEWRATMGQAHVRKKRDETDIRLEKAEASHTHTYKHIFDKNNKYFVWFWWPDIFNGWNIWLLENVCAPFLVMSFFKCLPASVPARPRPISHTHTHTHTRQISDRNWVYAKQTQCESNSHSHDRT